ncbi:hypothetical protein H5410_028807 [Solanum commersonii]|uniref:F-box associated beta-propeller type 3 domain-containing protein n=1 Tax=Solanum commersonii TaxID=4109 RepID=A0A9J5Z2Z1_SOLCO|nr:hypothetical protein H5410_028807 [Solanum commersonii]
MLCSNSLSRLAKTNYYVCNPTTKHYTTLPKSVLETENSKIHGISLAFDPAKSPHYKVICVRDSMSSPQHYQIESYSSQTGPWRLSGDPFIVDVNFSKGVYWNGSIYWISTIGNLTCLYYNLDFERDDSEWFVKYKIDFEHPDHELNYCNFTILYLVRGKRKEDAFLVLAASNDDKVMKYNLINKTFEKFCDYDVEDEQVSYSSTIGAFEYIESLCCV